MTRTFGHPVFSDFCSSQCVARGAAVGRIRPLQRGRSGLDDAAEEGRDRVAPAGDAVQQHGGAAGVAASNGALAGDDVWSSVGEGADDALNCPRSLVSGIAIDKPL